MHFSSLMAGAAKLLVLLSIGFSANATDPVILKTGREIYASLASLTGVSEKDPDVYQLYLQNIGRLPKQGLPAELSSNVVLATTELGGLFCQKAVQRERAQPASQRMIFRAVDFASGPGQFDDYKKGIVLDDLAIAFWQRDATDAEKQALSSALDAAAKGASGSADQTAKVIQIMCTIYATSLATLVR